MLFPPELKAKMAGGGGSRPDKRNMVKCALPVPFPANTPTTVTHSVCPHSLSVSLVPPSGFSSARVCSFPRPAFVSAPLSREPSIYLSLIFSFSQPLSLLASHPLFSFSPPAASFLPLLFPYLPLAIASSHLPSLLSSFLFSHFLLLLFTFSLLPFPCTFHIHYFSFGFSISLLALYFLHGSPTSKPSCKPFSPSSLFPHSSLKPTSYFSPSCPSL